MTEFKCLDEDLCAAAQIDADDVERAAAEGFEAIVSFRPDNEEPGQSNAELIASWAAEAGLSFHCLPLMPGQVTEAHIQGLHDVMESVEGPVLGFCRTGLRAAIVWALVRSGQAEMEERDILERAQKAGYDLKNVEPLISEVRGSLQT